MVNLFTSSEDFLEVQWEAEAVALSPHFHARRPPSSGLCRHPSVRMLAGGENPNDFSISSLYKCVKVCGCGDEVTDDISTLDKEKDQNK